MTRAHGFVCVHNRSTLDGSIWNVPPFANTENILFTIKRFRGCISKIFPEPLANDPALIYYVIVEGEQHD